MKIFRLHWAIFAIAVSVMGLVGTMPIGLAQTAGDNYLTYHGNLARTGWNRGESQLTHADIDNRTPGQGRFGKLWEHRFVHGDPVIAEQVYGAPIYYNEVIYSATERNWVYALNAADGALLWERYLDPPLNNAQFLNCGNISPWHGVTGTPVLDPDTETLYLINITFAGSNQFYKMYALDIATGANRPGWPVVLGGVYRGKTFDPTRVTQRGGLTLLDGWVYGTFSSRCDFGNWNGWIIGVNAADPALPLRVHSTSPDGNGAGIWGGAGISVDEDHYMYVATGNGTFNQGSNPYSFAQSVLRLDPEDPLFFTRDPQNFYTVPNVGPTNSRDEDIGGSSILVIPDQSDTPTDTPHMVLTSGKDGVVYLLNRDNLGGYAPPEGAQVQRLKVYQGCGDCGAKVAAAYFDAGEPGRFVYLAAGGGTHNNYVHWGDSNRGAIGAAGTVRAGLNSGPAVVPFNDRLFVVWISNDGTRNVMIKSSPNGRDWGEAPRPVGVTVDDLHTSPALTVFNDRLALAWIDRATRDVLIKFSEDGRVWTPDAAAVGAQAATFSSPALTVFNDRLYVSWIADTPDRDIMLKSSADGMDWSDEATPIGEGSDHAGAVAALGALEGRLYVFWVMTDVRPPKSERRIFYKSSPDGLDWAEPRQATGNSVRSESGLALVPFHDVSGRPRLHLFWLGNSGANPAILNRSFGRDLVTGRLELEAVSTDCYEAAFGGSLVGAAEIDGNLHIIFAANSNRDLLYKIGQPAFPGRGVVALQLTVENGQSKLVPAWATAYTLVKQPGSPYVSSNGWSNPVVWVAEPTSPARIYGYDAVTGAELFNSDRRPADRPSWKGTLFGTPVVINGKLFLGTEQGVVAYGIRPD